MARKDPRSQEALRRSTLSLAFLLVGVGLACKREDPQIRTLTEQAAHADEAAQQLRQAWSDQFRRLTRARVGPLPPEANLLLLTPEQKQALEARVRMEKDSSRKGLLREILEKDAELQTLNGQLASLRAALPEPEPVRPNDSHYGMALRFLRAQGQSEAEARQTLSRVPIFERLLPGFEVYHFFHQGEYGTWVSRGRAAISPKDYARLDPDLPINERDAARAVGQRLRRELAALEAERRTVEQEVAALQAEQARYIEGRTALQSENARDLARLNSLHYLVGVRDQLEAAGIIAIPLFGKDHSGPTWNDSAFTQHLDLRTGSTLTLRAQDLGLKEIGQVSVVPGSYTAGEHYRLSLSADRQVATIELLALPRFKNDKVVFALAE
ncbi:hypothetical protein [Geothrix sp. PMB-07]|uniref:hypothetical protein n=1 Tax=Geothrix sp. PMB-07 TaxID=3068640 RepID=UPI002740B1E7|nr:hypothetical protein [Geothrix sp. PMB-07]WLT31048.1 hypothetical protein Q9293_15125 [Geothrix sp. PMB-07]